MDAFEYFRAEDRRSNGTTRDEQSLRDAFEAMRSLNRDCLSVTSPWSPASSRRTPRVA